MPWHINLLEENLCVKESNYPPNASHAVKVETDSAIQLLELGYQFFGNRFGDTQK